MADHLRADLTRIGQMSRSLAGLRDEFSSLTRVADVGPAAGNAGLESVLSDFASNWSNKRDELVSDLNELSGLSARAVAAYRRTDDTLTHALTDAVHGQHSPSRPGPEGGQG